MIDSESVAIGGEVAAWVTDLLVVDEARGECEQAQGDAHADAFDGASAVAFECELALAGPEHRLDPLADRAERAVSVRLVLAVGAQEAGTEGAHELLELLAGEAFVGQDGVALQLDAGEHFGSNDALGEVRGGKLERDWHAVRRAQQIQPKAPEVAAVALAPAVAGVARQLRAARGLARLAAGDRGAIERSEVVAKRRRADGQVRDDPRDRGRERAQALVVARLLRQIRKQMPEPVARQREELPVIRQPQEHLRDGQRDELGVGDPRRAAGPLPAWQEIVNPHVKCRDEGVEVGEHEASLVDVAIATPPFGALVMTPRTTIATNNSESTI